MISERDYCSKVCGAKCCYKVDKELTIRCPKLSYSGNSCHCYEERFAPHMDDLVYVGTVEINKHRKVDFICARIKTLIEAKTLPKEIEDQCCIAHPNLLEANYE